tara:strand:- start:410 stop:1276 length:867 start_codon:yes stop_codon:yes gene_type:complete
MNTDTFSMDIEDKKVEFKLKSPSFKDQREAQKVYNQAFSDAVKSGCIVRGRLDDLLKEQGLWDDKKEMQLNTLQHEILSCEQKLAKGGISLNVAKGVALEMRELREKLRDLISVRTNLDNNTAEGQADNARFNYLVSCCLVYSDSNKPYFPSYEDYLNRSAEPVAIKGAQVLASKLYGLDDNYEKELAENKFLRQYKFVDEDLRWVNKEGKLTDADGRLIDENGRYIDDSGKYVDKEGNLVDDKGEYVVEFQPFLDEDGKPVVLESEGSEDGKSKRKTRKTKEEAQTA